MITSSKKEASSSSSSSSYATPRWEYDVFLSFRGEDTRTNFTDHLYTALKEKGINTFRDEEGLKRGKPISELFKFIEGSRSIVIVFSKNYVDSKWCLKELAKIVECMEKRRMIVLPVFYHVNPSDVRNQKGTFAKFFAQEIPCKRKICSMEEEEAWRAALKEVGSLKGWHLKGDRQESECIQQIVKDILLNLHDKTIGAPLLTTKLMGQAFQSNLDKIWESLMKIEDLSIGIHGMGGVGKTTLVTHIHNRLLEMPDSFNVHWVTVSKDFSIKKLQNDIAKVIKLDLSDEDDVRKRAAKLAQKLRENMKLRENEKLVLILDDVWEYFSLEEVGIPVVVNGCKLILTTRFSNICERMCQEKVRVVPLNEEEAWNLFMEKLGDGITLPVEIVDIARSIAKECAGLPLGIITMAGSMRGMGIINIHGWRNALGELKHSKAELDDMEEKVFGVLKFSYTRLKDLKLRECFLYCSLYPEDFKIKRDELIELLIDEGIIERKRSRQEEFDKGHSMLNTLENAYLLEGTEDWMMGKFVKMHDLLRDMAIQIARASYGFMVEAGKGLRDLPDEEEWKDDLVKVSLMCNTHLKIPSNASPRCPKLSTLMFNRNNFQVVPIPTSFFAHMSGLKILNLSYSGIEDLSDLISNLENLTTLLLRGCECLKHVPSLAKLTTLKRLDLGYTKIKEIPQGLEMLVNLRHLNLFSTNLKFFPTGILPKLSRLQYLDFYWNPGTLAVEGKELASLKKLETFKGPFYDINNFNTYVKLRSLEEEGGPSNYQLQVGVDYNPRIYRFSDTNHLRDKGVSFFRCSISISKGEDSLVLPKDVQCLELKEINDLRSLCDIPSFNNAAELKEISVVQCEGIDHILSSSSFSSCILPLQSVESVFFEYLYNLRVLIRGERVGSSPIPLGTFSRLKQFIMRECENIKKLFTPKLLLHLHNLEEIDVRACKELVEIIGASSNEGEEEDDDKEERNKVEGMDTTIFSLPKLRVFNLVGLPKLKSICSSSQVMVCDSIQNIYICDCPKLKRLPLFLPLLNEQPCPPPSMKKIRAQKEWWESLEWDHPNSKTVLQPYFY